MRTANLTWSAAAGLMLLTSAVRAEQVATRTFEDTARLEPGAPAQVTVANVIGSIRVTSGEQGQVRLRATETIRGNTADDVARARKEVELRSQRTDAGVAFRVRKAGDSGCDCGCPLNWHGYSVRYDIDLTVPADVSLALSTVNGGDIRVAGVHGAFDISNVDGSVTLTGVRSDGRARTVNGRLEASFEQAPGGSSSFETVNGSIDVAFPAGISTDLSFETAHGEAWTDFDVEPLPATPVEERGRGNGYRIRNDEHARVRVGTGGPMQSFSTLNGDINVRKQEVR